MNESVLVVQFREEERVGSWYGDGKGVSRPIQLLSGIDAPDFGVGESVQREVAHLVSTEE